MVTAASANSLTVTVPTGAQYKPISVTANGLTAYSVMSFAVTFPDGGELSPYAFEAKTDLPVGETPDDVATGDLDGDGKADMVVANGGYPYSISIYRNTSTGSAISFAAKIDYPTAIDPSGIAISDIDGDGKLDLVVPNESSFTVSVFRNIGTGGNIAFDYRIDLPASTPTGIAVGDLNKDGKPDLAAINLVSNTVSIFRNTSVPGSVSFAANVDYPTGQYPTGISIGDLDGDTWPEIVVANSNSNFLSIFKNNRSGGAISLTSISNLISGVTANKVIVADIDGDNKLDVSVTNGGISVYRNISNGSMAFSPKVDFQTADYGSEWAVADLDGDGKPDLALPDGIGSIAVLKNTSSTGAISFQNKVSFLTGGSPAALSVADFDGDSKPDLAIPNHGDNTVSVLKNRVGGPDIISYSPASAPAGTTVTITGARFTGITDVSFGGVPAQSFTVVSPTTIQAVVGTGASGEVTVTNSKGTGRGQGFIFLYPTYTPPVITSFTPASGPVGTTVTITGNNFLPSPAQNTVYFGATKATVLSASATSLTVQVPAGATYEPITVTTNQVTAYSTIPFVVTFQEAPAFTMGSFDAPQIIDDRLNSKLVHTIADADFDGDGKTDLIYGVKDFFVARNVSTSNSIAFAAAQKIDIGYLSYYLVEPADMDGDGKVDVVKVDGATFSVLKNTSSPGNISFVSAASYRDAEAMQRFTIKDLDLDGKPDLVMLVENADRLAIFRNTTNGPTIQFAPKVNLTTANGPVHISCGDLDGDGKPEVVITNKNENSISIFPNNSVSGTINLGTPVTYKTYANPIATSLADLDGDGKLDLAVLINGGAVQIFKNTGTAGSISLTQGSLYYTINFPIQLRAADLNGDGKVDLIAFSDDWGGFSVLKNLSNATAISFGLDVRYSGNNLYGEQEVADLNGDGKPDMVVGVNSGDIGVLKNKVGTARTVPAGANPVKGEIKDRMTVDQTVQTYNGNPYVQRHYDVEPVNDPATSTATVTLYFTQQDFDNFNAFPNHGPDLPVRYDDASGKANLRVYQYHGFSATGLPGSYSGVGTEIDPDDMNVSWSPEAGCWVVAFNVTGFSGFFVSNASFNSIVPPVITAGGATGFCQGGNVVLTSSATNNNQWYKDGVLINGANATTFQATASGNYSVNTTVNGIPSLASNNITVTAGQPPASPVITFNGTFFSSSSTTGNQWYREGVAIPGAVYQLYQPLNAANYSVAVTSFGCQGPASANYYYIAAPVITTDPGNVFCQGSTKKILTSSALANNQWYRNGVQITGATARTYEVTQSGNYTATVSDGKGTSVASNTITITIIPGPPKPTITVSGAYLVSSALAGNEWYLNGNAIQGAYSKTYKPVISGNYSVFARDPNTFCITESDKVYFSITGIVNIDNTHYIKLSPNPVERNMLLNYNLAGSFSVNLQIVDLNGHICNTYNNLSDGSEVNLAGLSKGMYFARITEPISKRNYVIKVVKL